MLQGMKRTAKNCIMLYATVCSRDLSAPAAFETSSRGFRSRPGTGELPRTGWRGVARSKAYLSEPGGPRSRAHRLPRVF